MSEQIKADLGVVIGRFSPIHNAHVKLIETALEKAEHVVVLIGSSGRAINVKNPWTFEQRKDMILSVLSENQREKVTCKPIKDYYYSDQNWVTGVRKAVYSWRFFPARNIILVGCNKDSSSYYLKYFSDWNPYYIDVLDDGLSSTQIREMLLGEEDFLVNTEIQQKLSGMLHSNVLAYLKEFAKTENYAVLKEEFKSIVEYKKLWSGSPFTPTFNTVDAVVVCNDHLLLVKRKNTPGKGLWALPGGYVNPDEFLIDSCLRELEEETNLKFPYDDFWLNDKQIFDHPQRCLRGRVITTAFNWWYACPELPEVIGGDDAETAEWVPLEKLDKMSDQLFEDHWDIISYFIDTREEN